MLAYFLPVSLSLLFGFFSVGHISKKNTEVLIIVVFISAFIFCGGYMTGSDWRNYEILYNEADWSLLSTYDSEKGFYIYMCLMKSIGFAFFPFLILSKFVVFIIITRFILCYATNFYHAFAIFLMTRGMTIFIDNPLRYMIALGFVIYAIEAVILNKRRRFFIFCLLAFTFHVSSVIVIFTIFFYRIRLKKKILIISYLILFFLINPINAIYFIDTFYPDLALVLGTYYKRAGVIEFSLFSVGRVVYFILFLLVVFNREKVIDRKYGEQLYSIAIVFFFYNVIAYALPTLHRLAMYYNPVFAIVLSIVLVSLLNLRLLFNSLVFLYFIVSFSANMYVSYAYLPYSNYFVHILLGKEYSFDFRSTYNKNKYFERTGIYPSDTGQD